MASFCADLHLSSLHCEVSLGYGAEHNSALASVVFGLWDACLEPKLAWGMLIMETIATIGRACFQDKKSIKQTCRELRLASYWKASEALLLFP